MTSLDVRLLYVTAPSEDVARDLAEHLVGERLVACVNLLPGMRSVYRWQGEICRDDEVVLIAKTTGVMAAAARSAIVERHPASCPCVVELPVAGGHDEFLLWVSDQVS